VRCGTGIRTFEDFSLHCSLFFNACFLPWTIKTLNESDISTLSLKHLPLDSDTWDIIFPHITLPYLSSLSIDLCSVTFCGFSKFLARHPQIKRLYIGSRVLRIDGQARLPITSLPQLTHLSATCHHLLPFLTPRKSMSSLQSVSIILRIKHRRHFDPLGLNNILLPISRRLTQLVELSLDVSFETSSDDWILLDVTPDWGVESALQHVSRISLSMGMYRLSQAIVTGLPRWLMLFPGLRHVSFSTLSQSWPMDLADRIMFIRSIRRRCAEVETVGLNGVVHSVDVWLGLMS